MGFKARKKLITRDSALQGCRADDCGEVSGAKDLRFIGREFHKRGEKLRNDRSENLSLVKTGERERHR